MDENYIPINWQDGSGESVEIGYLNPKLANLHSMIYYHTGGDQNGRIKNRNYN